MMVELQEAVTKLRESERQLRLVTDNAPVSIVHCDTELRYKFINRYHAARLREQSGLTADQVVGKPLRDVIGDKRFAIVEPYFRECLAGKTVEFEVEGPDYSGELQFFQARLEPEWRDGKVVGLVSASTNITRLKRAEAALRENKDRLQLALEAAQLGWWQYDPLNRVALWSDRRSKEIYDVSEDKTDIEEFTKRVHRDDVERVWAAMEAALDPTDPKPYAIEYRVQRGDGEVRWVEAHGLTYFEGASHNRRAVRMIGTAQDITERKQREEKEHLLMREVNHRARNMLSVVDAIVYQTVANSPEDYVERVSERVRALAAYQDLLVRSEWTGVEVEDLVRAQLALFADLVGSRILVCGPKLRLNAASAQAVGLTLHELTTNAGKDGALSKDTGEVGIGWGIEGETFTMSWTERHGPQVSPPQRRGFGTTVMQQMIERSVNGTVDLEYAPSGVIWRLTCPAVNVLEPAT